jgi:hypothetical protein
MDFGFSVCCGTKEKHSFRNKLQHLINDIGYALSVVVGRKAQHFLPTTTAVPKESGFPGFDDRFPSQNMRHRRSQNYSWVDCKIIQWEAVFIGIRKKGYNANRRWKIDV